ncbi:polysaccharide biosynthesis protein [Paenibacillus sp. MER TA 81-3]|uniref:polysaccharide biosynthesis protein n=1 Tax=Paenibacillus sp. MER TA 81-3 TaxID=2939573 RepID=UPI00203AFAEB|nr:polysaccharide biosynthesis protein [Paenibacillus sp. MER TA 81-3]MCM3337615.1 polysaccharide biosynthesis protein [Paenibacillus sp. MER TA 81-3]
MMKKTILITGGTGSWGGELISQLLVYHHPQEIRVFSRNEALQVAMKQQFNDPRLNFIVGDIRDKQEIAQACQGVDVLYHLAALKHVPICENQPDIALKTNVIGTQHVIEAAIEHRVQKVIYVSTDKASNPSSTYGITKAIGEKLIIHANARDTQTRFVCVRSGNVLGSTGSVIPIFKHQIQHQLEVGVTDMRMTRFFLTLEDAVRMLIVATEKSRGGETFIMNMPSCKIIDIAQVMIEQFGTGDVPIKQLGMRLGERLNETLISEDESGRSIHFDDQYFVILPAFPIEGLQEHYADCPPIYFQSYHSESSLMTKDEVRRMLKTGGFLA